MAQAPDEASREEWAWLSRAAHGDDEAFASLVRRYQGRLMNFFARLGDQGHAEDLVQETFMRLYRNRKRARPDARFTTYLHTLAHRVWVDHVRRSTRRADALARAGRDPLLVHPGGVPVPGGGRIDADRLLARLSPEHREAIVCVILEGLEYGEAAVVLGVPEGTVKSRVHYALRHLRQFIDGKEPVP